MKSHKKDKAKNAENVVMSQIEKGEITIKPKSYFVLLSLLTAISAAVVFAFGVFMINLSILRLIALNDPLRASNSRPLPGGEFPFWFLLASITSVAILVWIIRKKMFIGHKLPLWAMVISGVLFGVVFGFLVTQTNLNNKLKDKRPFRGLYNDQLRDNLGRPKRPRFYRNNF